MPMILDKIEALRLLADDHFGHDPDAIHWGHVGDLGQVDQLLATGWQPHTAHGAISGMLRKKLGLNVVLAHNDSGKRVYCVV